MQAGARQIAFVKLVEIRGHRHLQGHLLPDLSGMGEYIVTQVEFGARAEDLDEFPLLRTRAHPGKQRVQGALDGAVVLAVTQVLLRVGCFEPQALRIEVEFEFQRGAVETRVTRGHDGRHQKDQGAGRGQQRRDAVEAEALLGPQAALHVLRAGMHC